MNFDSLYLDCQSGISGDMTVAALLDLGADRDALLRTLDSLGLEGVSWEITQKDSYGIAGCDFNVILPEEHHRGGSHEHHHHHEHRNLDDVSAVLKRGDMTPEARDLALKIFGIVAESEAEAHGCPLSEVHFHEVGAVDSIADIAAAAVLIDNLGIRDCFITSLSEGSGTVHCQHGKLPVPVPAVVNIARRFSIPLRITETQGEMVTPTGIAIAAALRTKTELPEKFIIRKTGTGLGKRDFGRANFLRAMIISSCF